MIDLAFIVIGIIIGFGSGIIIGAIIRIYKERDSAKTVDTRTPLHLFLLSQRRLYWVHRGDKL